MKVLIITGGISSERKISLISAKAVKKALEKNGHQVKLFDLKRGFPALKNLLSKFDVVFPVLHGEEGEGGELQQFLQDQQITFVGGDPSGFTEGWFKIPFKKFCDQNKILTAPWKEVKTIEEVIQFGFPSVLKSSNGGSSKEVIILKSENQAKSKAVQELFKSEFDLMVEEYLPGVEVTVGVLGDQTLPVLEIIPPEGKWFDYKNKYLGTTQEIPDAPSLTKEQREKCQEIALKIHQILNLGSYSRSDFIVSNNQSYILEVNMIPGLTSESLFPKAAKAAGYSFEKLVEKLVNLSINKGSFLE